MKSASEIFNLYAGSPLGVRIHIAARWYLCPFEALGSYLNNADKVIDLGCGYGMWVFYLASQNPNAQFWGVDPDRKKIAVARQVVEKNHIKNVIFTVSKAENFQLPSCNLVTMIDMMYLLPLELHQALLTMVVEHLASGGRLLLKEMSRYPTWKYTWNWVEEWLAVKIFRFTQGHQLNFRHETEWVDLISSLGLHVWKVRLDAGYPHPHLLIIGDKS